MTIKAPRMPTPQETREMIECHHNVGPPTELHADRKLWRQLSMATVEVGAKRDSALAHLHVPGQAENLEPSAVGKDRSVPTHKSMQPACGN